MTETIRSHLRGGRSRRPGAHGVKGQKALGRADLVLYAGSLVSPAVLGWANPNAELVDTAKLNLADICAGSWRGTAPAGGWSGSTPATPPCSAPSRSKWRFWSGKIFPAGDPRGERHVAAGHGPGPGTHPAGGNPNGHPHPGGGAHPGAEKEALHDLARHGATLVIYLSIKLIDAVVAELIPAYGPETPVVVAYRVSWPDQQLNPGNPGHHCRAGPGGGHRPPGPDYGGAGLVCPGWRAQGPLQALRRSRPRV